MEVLCDFKKNTYTSCTKKNKTLDIYNVNVSNSASMTNEEDKSHNIAKRKNQEAWNSLRRFGQPLIVVAIIGSLFVEIHNRCKTGGYHELTEPILTFPLAGLALASCVNFSVDNPEEILRNYMYFFAKGLLVSSAILFAGPIEVFFCKLNEGWLKDIFTGNMLHSKHGFGFRTMVLFHTLNLFLNNQLTKFIYGC